jgi:hypothetical protein
MGRESGLTSDARFDASSFRSRQSKLQIGKFKTADWPIRNCRVRKNGLRLIDSIVSSGCDGVRMLACSPRVCAAILLAYTCLSLAGRGISASSRTPIIGPRVTPTRNRRKLLRRFLDRRALLLELCYVMVRPQHIRIETGRATGWPADSMLRHQHSMLCALSCINHSGERRQLILAGFTRRAITPPPARSPRRIVLASRFVIETSLTCWKHTSEVG